VQGPAGTHKLALGLNLGISYVKNKAKLLVVTFGGQGEIDFRGVAWVKSQAYLQKLARVSIADDGSAHHAIEGAKAQVLTFRAEDLEQQRSAEVTVLTFQIGVLTPEECIHRVRDVLEENAKDPFLSVLLCDTAELCTGFPLLSKDPMFFAALLDLFEAKRLLTVGIGVHATDNSNLRELNLALMAKASHRMVLWHFPEVEDLMQEMVERSRAHQKARGAAEPLLTEQLVSVVIDNVTGKHYKRQPKWIWVEEDPGIGKGSENKPKVLHFEPFAKPKIDWNPARISKGRQRK
jgi:hypothetical protein